MHTAASLIRTNCFLSSRALKCRCSVTMRRRTSLWSSVCSRWRSASRRNTWGGGRSQAGSQDRTPARRRRASSGFPLGYIWTHRLEFQDTVSPLCQVWPSNYIYSHPIMPQSSHGPSRHGTQSSLHASAHTEDAFQQNYPKHRTDLLPTTVWSVSPLF